MPGDLVYFVVPARDAEQAKRFYGELFEWRFAPGNIPSGFQIESSNPPGGLFGGAETDRMDVYFSVDDIGIAVDRIRELGGEAGEPEEIASGWMAECRDDQGVRFNIWAPKPGHPPQA